MKTKVCTKCGKEKSWDDYYKRKDRNWAPKPHCISCEKIRYKDYSERNKGYQLSRAKKYREENLEACKERCNKYKKDNAKELLEYKRDRYHNLEGEKEAINKRNNDRYHKTKGDLRHRYRGWLYHFDGTEDTKPTFEEYREALHSSGVCECCGRSLESLTLRQVDHCHKTGKIRGVLCQRCNQAEGLLGSVENIENLLKFIKERGN